MTIEFTPYQVQLLVALMIACVSASGGFQFQAMFYLLVVIFAGFDTYEFTVATIIYAGYVFIAGVFRAAAKV